MRFKSKKGALSENVFKMIFYLLFVVIVVVVISIIISSFLTWDIKSYQVENKVYTEYILNCFESSRNVINVSKLTQEYFDKCFDIKDEKIKNFIAIEVIFTYDDGNNINEISLYYNKEKYEFWKEVLKSELKERKLFVEKRIRLFEKDNKLYEGKVKIIYAYPV